MSIFDVYVAKIADYVESMRREGRRVREIDCPPAIADLLRGLPVQVGPKADPGLILRGDTFVELGNPEVGSCAFLLWTDNLPLVRDGRITLIGPDIQESPGASLPFGQVLMVGGKNLDKQDHGVLEHTQYISDQIEGYMIKSVSQLLWARVSKNAARKGFCFEALGRALMAIFKLELPKVQAMEVVFVTSNKDDLQPLENIAEQIRKIARDIVTENWKAKGFDLYECTFGWNCSRCPDQPVCDDIKELITISKSKADKQD